MNKHDTVININAILDKVGPPVTADCCIYKVPFVIRRHNDDAYTPKVLSIGPFHHHLHHYRPHLQNMERHKLIYVKAFHQRAETTTQTQPLFRYIDSITPIFRSCYSETFDFTDQELVKLIWIDSVFIIELFWRNYNSQCQDDVFLTKEWLAYHLRLDFLLLENQLPFFVVEQIFKISFSADTTIPSFLELTFNYFHHFNKLNLVYDSNISIRHFTDLIRIFQLQHPWDEQSRHTESIQHLYSVTELLEAGVRFKPSIKSESLLNLRFSGGVLEIPQLKVDDSTEILFRNIVALEQCHYPLKSSVTDYIHVLDFLINTEKDVDILVRNGILINWLRNNDSAAKLVNNLCKNVTIPNCSSDYSVLSKRLDKFYNNRWHKVKAILMHDYCDTPLQTYAFITGIVLMILSLIQTFCSLLQVVNQ